MKKYHIIAVGILLFICSVAHTQKSCLNTLREAKDLYEQGLIDEIPDLLAGCMESGFTRAQRIEAYKLIILTYLFDDDQFAAENMMDEFLRRFPEYEVMPNDPVEFIYLLESYKTSSSYSINLTFGPTFANAVVSEFHTVMNHSQTEFDDQVKSGFYLGLGVSRNLWKSINGTIGFRLSSYNYNFNETTQSLIGNENTTFAELKAEETLRRIDVPLSLSYTLGKGNLHYIGRLGLQGSILRKAELSLSRIQEAMRESLTESDIDISDHRTSFVPMFVLGAGVEYKVPRGYLVVDLRYNRAMNHIVKDDMRYTNARLNHRYLHVDDDFRLDDLTIGMGYHFSIYQSKKNRF